MKTVAGTLGVARSNLIERRDKVTQARGPYRKAEDAGLLLPIRAIIDERPTYGYRRVWALLNRHLRSAGKPTVNMKRVLRIMQNHGLTLERHTARRPGHTHDGVIIALHSNIRWCSDHLELHARNCEVVRILFVLDACDREIIAWWPWRTPVSPARWDAISWSPPSKVKYRALRLSEGSSQEGRGRLVQSSDLVRAARSG